MRAFTPRTIRKPRGCPTFYWPEIYPGVKGYAIRHRAEVWIPMIWGNGTGQVGKFLDALSPRCRIVNVINSRLKGMLERRGWTAELVNGIDVWRR